MITKKKKKKKSRRKLNISSWKKVQNIQVSSNKKGGVSKHREWSLGLIIQTEFQLVWIATYLMLE